MRTRTETRSRGEISGRVDRTAEDMDSRGADLEDRRSEVQSLREAVENMDFGGTSDAIEIMENALDNAEKVVVDTAERQSEELDEVQADNAEHGDELQDRADADRGDAENISDVSSGISIGESVNELTRARDKLLEDFDFLDDALKRAQEAGERSEEHQNKVREFIMSGGRARR